MDMKNLNAEDIMLDEVIVSYPDDLVAVVNLKMVRANIGGLPIVDEDNRLLGIITHRDTLLAGDAAMAFKVKSLMSTNLTTVSLDTSLIEISKIMVDTGFQRIPVVKDGKLRGLITQTCVIRAVAENL